MLLNYFTPALYLKSYEDLDPAWLVRRKIRLLILDIDNTLAAHDEQVAGDKAKAFVHRLKDAGIQAVVMSNNNKERVSRFAASLDVPSYYFSTKPLKRTYKKVLRDTGLKPDQCAVIGDQLLTDILGGSRMGLTTILTTPLVTRDIPWTKLNRVVENQVYRLLEHEEILKRGDYDE